MGIFIAAVILLSLLWTNLFMIEYWYHQTTMYDVKISTILEVFVGILKTSGKFVYKDEVLGKCGFRR